MCLKLICFYASPGVISLISVLPEIKKKILCFPSLDFFQALFIFNVMGTTLTDCFFSLPWLFNATTMERAFHIPGRAAAASTAGNIEEFCVFSQILLIATQGVKAKLQHFLDVELDLGLLQTLAILFCLEGFWTKMCCRKKCSQS